MDMESPKSVATKLKLSAEQIIESMKDEMVDGEYYYRLSEKSKFCYTFSQYLRRRCHAIEKSELNENLFIFRLNYFSAHYLFWVTGLGSAIL